MSMLTVAYRYMVAEENSTVPIMPAPASSSSERLFSSSTAVKKSYSFSAACVEMAWATWQAASILRSVLSATMRPNRAISTACASLKIFLTALASSASPPRAAAMASSARRAIWLVDRNRR